MIWYLASYTNTVEPYLETWGQAVAGRFRVATYGSLFGGRKFEFEARPGTYIFSDIERMTAPVAKRAARAWKMISEQGGDARILNHPTRSMRRYELLRTLFEHGDNAFNAYRLVECRRPRRGPVFIREENEHSKNLTPLLHTPEELEAAVAEISARGDNREDKLVVEFRDTRDDQGVFYKYAAFRIGEHVIPWHLWASRRWVVHTRTRMKTPEILEKERDYVETNPHERELRDIFRLARIDYGKMDYSILDGRLQVWEINTNPNTGAAAFLVDTEREAMLNRRFEHFAAAFAEIDVEDAAGEPGLPE